MVSPLQLGVRGIEQSDLRHYRITQSVEPWISADTVLQAYRAVQSLVLAGGDNRLLRDRSLELMRFIASQRVLQGKQLPWRCLMKRYC